MENSVSLPCVPFCATVVDMFLNSHSAIADLKLTLLIMGCEHFSNALQTSKFDDNSYSRRRQSNFFYYVLGQLGIVLSFTVATPAWSNSLHSTQELPFVGQTDSLLIEHEQIIEREQTHPDSLSVLAHTEHGPSIETNSTRESSSPTPLPLSELHRSNLIPSASAKDLLEAPVAQPNQETLFLTPPQVVQCWQPNSACSLSRPVKLSDQNMRQAPPASAPESEEDAELGELRIREMPEEPEDGGSDPELGTLLLEEIPIEPSFDEPPIAVVRPPRQPSVYLLGRVDYFRSSNVFTEIDPVNDALIRAGLSLFYAPALGPKTFLITSIDANSVRYTKLGARNNLISDGRRVGSLNYDEWRFRVGIFQRLSDRMSGEIGWSNQRLFQAKEGFLRFFSGKEFFNDTAFRLEFTRQDPLSKQLTLNTFYQFRWSFADKTAANDIVRDRIINSAIASLSYSWSPKLQTAIDYQYAWTHFTRADRDDHYHQLVGRLTYTISPRTQMNLFSGFSFGNSTDNRIDFNGFIFGAGFVFNTPLF